MGGRLVTCRGLEIRNVELADQQSAAGHHPAPRLSVSNSTMRNFNSLSEREILALAIALEEEDERIYADFAEGLRQDFPASAAVFDGMREEESGHRRRLIELYREKYGDHIPLFLRQDVRGLVNRKPVLLVPPLGLEAVR